jgi:hypothetical protein
MTGMPIIGIMLIMPFIIGIMFGMPPFIGIMPIGIIPGIMPIGIMPMPIGIMPGIMLGIPPIGMLFIIGFIGIGIGIAFIMMVGIVGRIGEGASEATVTTCPRAWIPLLARRSVLAAGSV